MSSEKSSFRKKIVMASVVIGAFNALCIGVSLVFMLFASAAIFLGHHVGESAIETFARVYTKNFIFWGNPILSAIAYASIIMFLLFLWHQTSSKKDLYYKSSER